MATKEIRYGSAPQSHASTMLSAYLYEGEQCVEFVGYFSRPRSPGIGRITEKEIAEWFEGIVEKPVVKSVSIGDYNLRITIRYGVPEISIGHYPWRRGTWLADDEQKQFARVLNAESRELFLGLAQTLREYLGGGWW